MLSQILRLLLVILGGYFLYKLFFPSKGENELESGKKTPKTKTSPPKHKISVDPDEIKDANYNKVEDE